MSWMMLKGKPSSGSEHRSCAFRKVVHFFCSTLSPPLSPWKHHQVRQYVTNLMALKFVVGALILLRRSTSIYVNPRQRHTLCQCQIYLEVDQSTLLNRFKIIQNNFKTSSQNWCDYCKSSITSMIFFFFLACILGVGTSRMIRLADPRALEGW